MRVINPVLRNECKMAVRNKRFTFTLFIYIAVIAFGVLLYYREFSSDVFASGLKRENSAILYVIMAIVQAIFLMFLVPSLTSSSISSEREKQTLDILLSTKLTSIQIILGKLLSSSLRVVIIIICTLPLYAVASLMGGLNLGNIIEITAFFIVNTIFVGALGILISTSFKTSKVSTTISYFSVLFIYVGILILAAIIAYFKFRYSGSGAQTFTISPIVYLSPVSGFISILANQVSIGDFGYMMEQLGLSSYTTYISIGVQLVLAAFFVYLASVKLDPLKEKKIKIKLQKKRG